MEMLWEASKKFIQQSTNCVAKMPSESCIPFSHGFVPSHRFVFRVCRGLQINYSIFSLEKLEKTTFIS